MLARLFLLAFAASSAVFGSPTQQQIIGSEAELSLSEKWSYSDCGTIAQPYSPVDEKPELSPPSGTPSDIVRLRSLEVSPDPPKPGQNLTITASGTVLETIKVRVFLHVSAHSTHQSTMQDGAWAQVVIKLGLIKLLDKTFDLCQEA